FNFTGRFTGVNNRWENALADMLLGFPSRYQQDSNTTFDIYQHMYFLFEQALIHPDRNNFAPRFGFAYSLTPTTVIRGAYGIFYNHTNRLGREGLLGFNPPFIILAD